MASFDAKAAFDTVTLYVQRLAWERGRITSKVSVWLAMMDAEGIIIPRTPLSEQQIHSVYSGSHMDIPHKLAAHKHDADTIPGIIKAFNAERGAPQGDGPSLLVFNSILDILLSALQIAHERHMITHDGNTVCRTPISTAPV